MISVEGVHKRFGSQVVLNGIDLKIEDGKTTTIVGPSGVGKSVLLKLILGIMKADAGRIFIDDDEISAVNTEVAKNRIRDRVGVLFQSAALFDSLTVYDNVAFPLRERLHISANESHERVSEMLEELSLVDVRGKYPEEISIGTRKRVGMARCLVSRPEVVLIDEPNTGLDPLVGQEVYDLIVECKEKWGFTGVVISHELPEVFQVSDRVAMLLNGKVVFEGAPDEFSSVDIPEVRQFLTGSIDGPIRIQ